MSTPSTVDRITTGLALILLALAGWRSLGWGGQDDPPARPDTPLSKASWQSIVASEGPRSGQATPSPTVNTSYIVVVFTDYECPVCRRFAEGPLDSLKVSLGDSLSVIYRHWPLSYHRGALPAAIAAECSGWQGRFDQMSEQLYSVQSSLSTIDDFWPLAKSAGVSDSTAFATCLSDPEPLRRIKADSAMLLQLPVPARGTPTVIANALMLGKIPDAGTLEKILRRKD
jgi:protein-disulfide isomerase